MEGKPLAIDSSIWLYQFQATMRDKEGRGLHNAHVLGFLRRICKLLFYGIKPVFVFDGGAPAIKRSTIVSRLQWPRLNCRMVHIHHSPGGLPGRTQTSQGWCCSEPCESRRATVGGTVTPGSPEPHSGVRVPLPSQGLGLHNTLQCHKET